MESRLISFSLSVASSCQGPQQGLGHLHDASHASTRLLCVHSIGDKWGPGGWCGLCQSMSGVPSLPAPGSSTELALDKLE